MRSVFTRGLSRVAETIEREFYRIEKENRWLSSLINGLIAGLAVGIVSYLFQERDLLLFACLGSSAASVVFDPLSRRNSLRVILIAYLIALAASAAIYPIHSADLAPLSVQCFLAVSISIALMRLFDAPHPAAVGSALAFILFDRNLASLAMLSLAILGLLTVVKILAYIYLEELQFRFFAKEFHRDYYGKEIRVTVVREPIESNQSEPRAGV